MQDLAHALVILAFFFIFSQLSKQDQDCIKTSPTAFTSFTNNGDRSTQLMKWFYPGSDICLKLWYHFKCCLQCKISNTETRLVNDSHDLRDLGPAAPPFLWHTLDSLVEWWSSSDINLDISGIVVICVNSAQIWKEVLWGEEGREKTTTYNTN